MWRALWKIAASKTSSRRYRPWPGIRLYGRTQTALNLVAAQMRGDLDRIAAPTSPRLPLCLADGARAAHCVASDPPSSGECRIAILHRGTQTMRDEVPCEFPAGYDGTALLERLAQVLDPELDESILDLGFVRALRLRSGHAEVALRLPTSWCAVNFAYLMAEDVRHALLSVDGVHEVTVSLGDHCAAGEIEAAVNDGRAFAEAFPGEAAGSLEALRLTFLRKGYFTRQERLLREMRDAGCSAAAVCALRLGEVSLADDIVEFR